MSGLARDWCSKLQLQGCSALGHSTRHVLAGLGPDASMVALESALESIGCSCELRPKDCVDGHSCVALDIPQFDDDQSRQKSELCACDAHEASPGVLESERFAANAFDSNVEVWTVTLHCLSLKSRHHPILTSGHHVDVSGVDASPWSFSCRS